MTSREKNLIQTERLHTLWNRLSQKYEPVIINNAKYLHSDRDQYFAPMVFTQWDTVVVEYAQGYEEALQNQFEDGDQFYLGDYDDNALFEAVVEEIES